MGVTESNQFPGDAYTPICNSCMATEDYDISIYEYEEKKAFWDSYICPDCRKRAQRTQGIFPNPGIHR